MTAAPRRILMLCDWLPPDFGAVGQYALADARALAGTGAEVLLVGFTSGPGRVEAALAGAGSLVVRRVHRPAYDRSDFVRRALWTLGANLALLWAVRDRLRHCDELRFTGSPPYLLHFVMPLAMLLGLRTRYRITDFHPECLIATLGRTQFLLGLLQRLTVFWRRRVDTLEVLGDDQRERLAECGVDTARVLLRRDPSPVAFGPDDRPAAVPPSLAGAPVVLYSGNWGVAHDADTFVDGYARAAAAGLRAGLWLNATGARAEIVETACRARGLPVARTQPVPLAELPGVLLAADLHLITLRDAFVGYVLPSKVYACIASGRPILFVGSARSDVHRLCESALGTARYRRVDVGDAEGVAVALRELLATRGEKESGESVA